MEKLAISGRATNTDILATKKYKAKVETPANLPLNHLADHHGEQ